MFPQIFHSSGLPSSSFTPSDTRHRSSDKPIPSSPARRGRVSRLPAFSRRSTQKNSLISADFLIELASTSRLPSLSCSVRHFFRLRSPVFQHRSSIIRHRTAHHTPSVFSLPSSFLFPTYFPLQTLKFITFATNSRKAACLII